MRSTVMRNGHTTVVWYGGSCINKYNTLTGASIQVLVVQKYSASFNDIYNRLVWSIMLQRLNIKDYCYSKLGWYSQICHKE